MWRKEQIKPKNKKTLWIVLGIVAVIFVSFAVYINIYYIANEEARQIASEMIERNETMYFLAEGNKGVIIYPGGKVDEAAYAPLAKAINSKGYLVAIAKMPMRLAIFEANKANEIISANPQVKDWVIAGHSLGGTVASMYVANESRNISGIVFMGSYPYKDLSDMGIFALDIRGENDLVLDKSKAEDAKAYYPKNTRFEIISGGNHAGFGGYGPQQGDGQAKIGYKEQIEQTAEIIAEAFG